MGDALNSDYASLLLDCLSSKFTDKTTLDDCMRVTGMKALGRVLYTGNRHRALLPKSFGVQAGQLRDRINSIFESTISVSYNNDAVVLVRAR